jgi:hypothetical protein
MIPPIADRARQAATVVFNLNMMFSIVLGIDWHNSFLKWRFLPVIRPPYGLVQGSWKLYSRRFPGAIAHRRPLPSRRIGFPARCGRLSTCGDWHRRPARVLVSGQHSRSWKAPFQVNQFSVTPYFSRRVSRGQYVKLR